MLTGYLSTIWKFLNSSFGTTIIKEGMSTLLKGLIDRWKEKKSKTEQNLTEEDLKEILQEQKYDDEKINLLIKEIDKEIDELSKEIDELKKSTTGIIQNNEKGTNIGNNFAPFSITIN